MATAPEPNNADAVPASDDTARWLAGAGVALDVVAVALTLWRRRT
jgi:hypothetical protein